MIYGKSLPRQIGIIVAITNAIITGLGKRRVRENKRYRQKERERGGGICGKTGREKKGDATD